VRARPHDRARKLPGDHPDVSANASQAAPAKILAVFIVDGQDQLLTTPRQDVRIGGSPSRAIV
jgi:hypothetical protein